MRRRGSTVMIVMAIVTLTILVIGTMVPFILIGEYSGGNLDEPTGVSAGTGTGTGGDLCPVVPEPYATIFRNAGAKFKVQPAFIGAIFVGEHGSVKEGNYRTWPNPDGPWATSPRGAAGPFQFMPLSWQGYQEDGNGDGVKDRQNLTDAAFSAARMIARPYVGGGKYATDETTLRNAASEYNSGKPWSQGQRIEETRNYVNNLVLPAFAAFYCPTTTTFGPVSGGSDRVPLYRQYDPRYRNNQVGGKDFSKWGCCPTSAAMVMRYHNAPVDPIIVAKLTVDGGFYPGYGGTKHGLPWLKAIGEPYGINQREEINVRGGRNWDRVLELLENGKPLIARGEAQPPYSRNGHCIVLTGYNRSTNMVGVNNPAERLRDGPFPLEHMKRYTTVVYYLGK